MFVLEITYTASADRVEAALPEHLVWVDDHFANGAFLASGPKNPRDGGVISCPIWAGCPTLALVS